MKQLTFSRNFPSFHPKKGQPTYFVEKIALGFIILNQKHPEKFIHGPGMLENYFTKVPGLLQYYWHQHLTPKYHTIRAGHRWKEGDVFAPKVWSGIPYRSKTITFLPPVRVEKVFDFYIDECGVESVSGFYMDDDTTDIVSKNDGLTRDEYEQWLIMPHFRKAKPFDGQIICWNPFIEY